MPSSGKYLLGEMNPAKADQGDHLGLEGQRLQCRCCQWDPGRSLRKAPPDTLNGRQNKKKSRKHQRCMMRRTLERKGLQGPKLGEETLYVVSNPSKTCGMQGREVSESTKEDVEKDHRTFCPISVPSAETARQHPSSQDFGNPVPLPSPPGAGSDSFSYQKPKARKLVAVDCEMVGTGPGGKVNELARCTVVNYDGDVIYDKYIRPQLPVVDYRTRWSGITPRHMEKATPFMKARAEVLQILRDKIVVGHAIHNDFRALKYFHPREWTRDTSQSPHLREKCGLLVKASVSLKSLAKQLLHKEIQVSRKGHSSVEDAQASMELYRLVEIQWEKDMTARLSACSPLSPPDNSADNDRYMDDRYWPEDLDLDCK